MPGTRFTDVRRFDRSTRPTATCSTRPGPAPPRAWWRWPTTRRPAGAGWAGAGRPRRGPTCWCRSSSGPICPPTSGTWPAPVVALAAAEAVRRGGRGGAWGSSGPTTCWPPTAQAGRGAGRGRPGRVRAGRRALRPADRGGDRDQRELARDRRRPARRAGRIGHVAAASWPDGRSTALPLLDALLAALEPRVADLGIGRRPGPPGRRPAGPLHHARAPGSGWSWPTSASRGRPPTSPPRATWWSRWTGRHTDGGRRRRRPPAARRPEPAPAPRAGRDRYEYHSPDHATTRHRWRRLHRLELRPLLGAAPPRRRRGGLRRPHLCRQPAQPGRRRGPDRLRPGRHRRPRGRWPRPWPSHQIDVIVNFAAESHNSLAILDPGPVLPHQRARHPDPGRGGPPPRGLAVPPHLHLRGLRRPAPRLGRGVHRGDPVPAPDPLQRLQGRCRPRRAGLRGDLRPAGHHHQLLQQLRALPVPREGHPAVHRPGPRRPAPAPLRLDPEPAGVAARRRPLPGHRAGAAARRRWGRPTTWAAGSRPASRRSPTPCSTPPAGPQSLKEIVPDRPSHDRRYLLDSSKIRKELGWEPTVPFAQGLADTVGLVRGQPELVGAAARPGPGGRGGVVDRSSRRRTPPGS